MKIKSEKGYTLLLTLIITTIIILFFATFTVQALSQQKRVDFTDGNYETTAITEMGVEFYQAHITNLIYLYSNETKRLINELDTKKLDYPTKVNNIKIEQMNSLKNKIYNLSSSLETQKIQLEKKSEKYFTILDNYDEKVKIYKTEFNGDFLTIHVRGNKENKFQVISAKFNFPKDLTSIDGYFDNGVLTPTLNFPECNKAYSTNCIENGNVTIPSNLNNKIVIFNGTVTLNSKNRIEFNNQSRILINKLVIVSDNPGNKDALKVKNTTLCIKDISEESIKRINSAANAKIYILVEGNPSLTNPNPKSENLKFFVNKADFQKYCTFENSSAPSPSQGGGFLTEVIYR